MKDFSAVARKRVIVDPGAARNLERHFTPLKPNGETARTPVVKETGRLISLLVQWTLESSWKSCLSDLGREHDWREPLRLTPGRIVSEEAYPGCPWSHEAFVAHWKRVIQTHRTYILLGDEFAPWAALRDIRNGMLESFGLDAAGMAATDITWSIQEERITVKIEKFVGPFSVEAVDERFKNVPRWTQQERRFLLRACLSHHVCRKTGATVRLKEIEGDVFQRWLHGRKGLSVDMEIPLVPYFSKKVEIVLPTDWVTDVTVVPA